MNAYFLNTSNICEVIIIGPLSKGNSTLRPLEGARGTPSACPVSEAWIKYYIELDIGRRKPMT